GDDGHLVPRRVGQRNISSVGDVDGEGGAVDGGDLLAVEPGHVGGHHFALDHVVGEDAGEVTGGIGEELVQRALRQGREGLVGGREDREGPVAPQRLFQAGGLHGGDERAEVARPHGGVDDVGRLGGHRVRRGRG